MISNSFFAGLESFMEDDVVQEQVDVAPEEAVAEETDAADEAAEVTEAVETAEGDVAKTEMVFAKFDELDRMIAHVQTYGVDRSFLSICNHDNVLGTSFGIVLPSCESFDAVGDPYSSTSIAALEGLGEAVDKAWEWIKKKCAQIRDFFKRIWNKIVSFFSNKADKVAEKAEAASAMKVKSDAERTEAQKEAAKKEVVDPKGFAAVVKECQDNASKLGPAIAQIEKDGGDASFLKRAEEIKLNKIKIKGVLKHHMTKAGQLDARGMDVIKANAKSAKLVINELNKSKADCEKKVAAVEKDLVAVESNLKRDPKSAGAQKLKKKYVKRIQGLNKVVGCYTSQISVLQAALKESMVTVKTFMEINGTHYGTSKEVPVSEKGMTKLAQQELANQAGAALGGKLL